MKSSEKSKPHITPLMILALVIVLLLVVLIVRAVYTLTSVKTFKNYWSVQNTKPAQDGSIVIAALGDSTVQSIGALSPQDGFAGQVAKRVSRATHKPVKLYNFSRSGVESGHVLNSQLAKLAELPRVDVVLVAVGPNDITHKQSLESYLKNYRQIMQKLPVAKTVIASLPPMGPKDTQGHGSDYWNKFLIPLAAQNKITVAPVFDNVKPHDNNFRTYGGDFYHPSKYGYSLWADAFEQPVLTILGQTS